MSTTPNTCPFPHGGLSTSTEPAAAKPFESMPGPRGHWLLGSVPGVRSGLLNFLEQMQTEHGDILRTRLFHMNVVLVSHPDLAYDLLVRKAKASLVVWKESLVEDPANPSTVAEAGSADRISSAMRSSATRAARTSSVRAAW